MKRRPKTANCKKFGVYAGLVLYFALSLLLYITAIPLLVYLSFKQKYKKSIPARFFLVSNPPLDECDVWFHSCSLGETKAVAPLVKNFQASGISVITNTGYEEAGKISQNSRFLPYEIFLPFWIGRHKLLVVMEAELWLMLFAVARARGAKTALINARISEKSYPKYKRFAFFYKMLFCFVDAVFAQSEIDKVRLLELGAKNVQVTGNIKQSVGGYELRDIKTDDRLNFTAASTHEGEEEAIVQAFASAGLFGKERLVVVPRHPERFESVAKFLADYASDSSLSFSRFSDECALLADIVLVDTIGELVNVYAKSYLVVLGGAFAQIGGHNPLEPAYFGVKLISGTHIFNQNSSFEKVKNGYLCVASELSSLLSNHKGLKQSELSGLEDALGETKRGLLGLLQR